MKVLLQRVTQAGVEVDGESVGRIDAGLLLFVGVEKGDDAQASEALARRVLGYRVFADEQGRMNRNVRDAGGAVLAVSQFTLAADTGKGMRPSFAPAADPDSGRRLYDALVAALRERHDAVRTGRFGARMRVALVNEGPVTFWLRARPDSSGETKVGV